MNMHELPAPNASGAAPAAMAGLRALPRPIWIDLDNSPHVPFFRPIAQALRAQGCELLMTARDAYQVTDLLRLHRLDCRTIGRHYGRRKTMKVLGLLVRAVQLLPLVLRERPVLAVSHGSRAQALVARLLRIPCVVIADYEHVAHLNRADLMIVPEAIPAEVAGRFADRLLRYPGIKEDVYAADFVPDPALRGALGIGDDEILVTLRPPATEAHYHVPESEVLLDAVVERLAAHGGLRTVLLPRSARQAAELARRWPRWLASGRVIVPREAVEGLNLVWHSDLVISGGGTMNREAAALGVPVYSIFRGPLGAVDRYLAAQGRLVLLASAEEVRSRIVLARRMRPTVTAERDRRALDTIVAQILDAVRRPAC
jgi:predicted glycosyltransferase